MKKLALAAMLAGLLPAAAPARKMVINVGTAAPEGTPWHRILQRTREEWGRITGGQIGMRIFPSGVQGDEIEMTRLVRIGQLHAVGLSGVGLAAADPGVAALGIPMLIASYEEFDYVRDRLAPVLEKRLEQKGFVTLQWSDVGWVHFFTRTPVRTPADLRKLKLFTSAGDPESEKLYKEFGLQVVPLAVTDLLTSLKTNLIQAFDVPPLFALTDQSFGVASFMTNLKWMQLAGATVLSKQVWLGIPEAQRAQLLAAARAASERVRAEVRKMGEDAIVEMRKRGLKTIDLTPAEVAQWRSEAETAYPKMRGRVIPADLFDEAVRLRNEYRAKKAQAGSK
ncbi:MAG: TRAP transporter substrate-binding protein DctP [Bryobacteraceae bacterium]